MRRFPVELELKGGGIHVRGSPLFLDARRRTPLAFVSHAHGDHIARHDRVIATRATLALMEARLGALEGPLPAPYRQPFELGALKIELFPAGHVLGSAQIRLTREGKRIVYTGDLNVVPSLTAEAAEVAECEVLIIESTFGHPRYRFPPKDDTLQRIRSFVERSHLEGGCPVLLGYSLGKAQEAIAFLAREGFGVAAHESIFEVCEVYGRLGTELPGVRRFDGQVREGEVLVFPPHLARATALRRVGLRRTAVLTGWALDPGARYRYGADEAFPLSDHADFDGLLSYALSTGAKTIYTVHGFDEDLARALREKGRQAWPLKPPRQLELF